MIERAIAALKEARDYEATGGTWTTHLALLLVTAVVYALLSISREVHNLDG